MDYERLIKRYARQPEKLNSVDREQVERILQSDPAAAQLFEFFQASYEEFEATGEDPSPEVDLLVYKLNSSVRVISSGKRSLPSAIPKCK